MCQAAPGLVITPPPVITAPFMSQIAGVPFAFCHSRSDLLSPLKSLRGTAAMSIVVVTAAARLLEALPSLITHVTVRVGLRLPLRGLLPDAKLIESSTD